MSIKLLVLSIFLAVYLHLHKQQTKGGGTSTLVSAGWAYCARSLLESIEWD